MGEQHLEHCERWYSEENTPKTQQATRCQHDKDDGDRVTAKLLAHDARREHKTLELLHSHHDQQGQPGHGS